MSFFEKIQQRARILPGWVRGMLILPPIVYVIYEAFTYTGIWRIITELQLDMLGNEYYPVLSGMLSFLVAMIPMIVIQQILISSGWFGTEPKD
ncbi:MAG: hypothetical protein ACPG4Z_03040 [Chitinophagales bacterium]